MVPSLCWHDAVGRPLSLGCQRYGAQRLCRRAFSRRMDGYLHYYGKLKNQEGMLRDRARVEGYRAGLLAAASRLRDATVLDIGTGSGIMAMLAAQCGAKKVFAVEASPEVARVASRLARANGFVGTIEVIPKHLEDITDEDISPGSVDVIVSELFSHFLVGELGLQPVTLARKRFLRPGGLVLPAIGRLMLSPFDDKELGAELRGRHSFWAQRDFYGLNLTSALKFAEEQSLCENVCDLVDPATLLVAPAEAPFEILDLAGPTDPDVWRLIEFEAQFPQRARDAVVDGLCGWWDIEFSGDGISNPAPVLSTAPDAPPTVWAQNRFMLNRPLAAKATDRLAATCQLRMNSVRESYTLKIELRNRSSGSVSVAGPIELSNVYARHFASPLPFPVVDGDTQLPLRGDRI